MDHYDMPPIELEATDVRDTCACCDHGFIDEDLHKHEGQLYCYWCLETSLKD